ncbi:MAG: purine nucleoside permease [Verrucomicrobia bacterium]|nr:purine nucleoside permease [Verrucomicrobiota bacterium]
MNSAIILYMHRLFLSAFLLLVPGLAGCSQTKTAQEPIPIKVVVVAMFEIGDVVGDRPGEFQYWVERLPLDQTLDFPQGYTPLRYNAEKGILGVTTGIGTQFSTATIMGLGMDPRFDLTKAYWLIAGIAGGDPEDTSPGDAVWADWAIDGDISHEIDPREVPDDWPTGYIPFRNKAPYQLPMPASDQHWGVRYQLNPQILNWAYQLTKDTELTTSEGADNLRNKFSDFAGAQHPPRVRIGAQLAAATYWHGALMNDWANRWVDYWTEGQGNYFTAAMEDTGTMQALTRLNKAGKADINRVMVLRGVTNYTRPIDSVTAAKSLEGETVGHYSAYMPTVENVYRTGSPVVEALLANWETYKDTIPSAD